MRLSASLSDPVAALGGISFPSFVSIGNIPVNHSEFFAPVIEPTMSTGTQDLVVAALAYLEK